MKKIILRKVPIESNREVKARGFTLDYWAELLAVITRFPDGITPAEMRQYTKLNEILWPAADADHIFIEDADHALLADRLSKFRYSFYATEILDFVDAMLNAETVTPADLVKSARNK